MAQKQNKNKAVAAGAGSGPLLPAEAERVREQIAARHSKAALQMAKDLHKRCGSTESEVLLVEAYQARIEDLLKLGMTVEAKTLLGIVSERFPAAAQRLADQQREIHALDGRLEEVVGPLGDPNLPTADRDRIETFIRQRIHDLPALAAVSSLPPEHSLRLAAAALADAFQVVTQGPVEDGILALPEVSRRSPLASWKALVRAIACYYRREDEECNKWLQAIAEDSVPARLLPAFNVMRGKKTGAKFTIAEVKLIAVAGDQGAILRPALAAMEKAFATKKQKPILEAARSVMAASDPCDATLREHLRQHIAVRCIMLHVPIPSVHGVLGGSARRDAYYFRLLARTLEERQNAESFAEAAIVWEDFRREAIKENWFAAGGLEDGVLALHVAQLVDKLPEDVVEEMQDREASYRNSNRWSKKECLPSAETLYQRACEADPHPEAFQMWLSWARKQGPWQVADKVAEHWRKSQPTDIQPLLYLTESAEKREAFKKSLKYLEEAEDLDRLNPEVRRAKLRLLLAAAIRHLRQRKTHLAKAGIEQIETVPEVRPGEIAALAAALRWCAAAVDGDKVEIKKQEAELTQSMGSVAGHLLIAALLEAANSAATIKAPLAPPRAVSKDSAIELLSGAVKACVLGEWAGLSIPLPRDWDNRLIATLYLPNCPLDAAQMLVLGEAGLNSFAAELAYNVSTVGLTKGKANARFLFLRARSLPRWAGKRWMASLMAALELARRERNTELTGKILDLLNGKQSGGSRSTTFRVGNNAKIASRPVSPELLSQILEEEKELVQFPIFEGYRSPKYEEELDSSLCDCPKCRAKRGEPVDESEFFDEDEDFEDEDDLDDEEDEFDETMPPLTPELMEMFEDFLRKLPPEMVQQIKKDIAAGDDPITAIDRAASKTSPKKGKAAKLPRPEQSRLF